MISLQRNLPGAILGVGQGLRGSEATDVGLASDIGFSRFRISVILIEFILMRLSNVEIF